MKPQITPGPQYSPPVSTYSDSYRDPSLRRRRKLIDFYPDYKLRRQESFLVKFAPRVNRESSAQPQVPETPRGAETETPQPPPDSKRPLEHRRATPGGHHLLPEPDGRRMRDRQGSCSFLG